MSHPLKRSRSYTVFQGNAASLPGLFWKAFPAVILLWQALQLDAQDRQVTFTDAAKSSGIDFRYTIGDDSYVNILESSGSGITVFDYNNDRLMDILLLNGTYIEGISDKSGRKYRNSTDRLYRNDGNGKFTDMTKESGLIDFNWSEAAVPVDIDNDGDLDLYLLNYGPNRFFRNNGNGTFTDITADTGLAGPEKLNGFTKWSIGASFFDYNSDGRPDVLTGNFLAFDPAYISTAGPGIMPHPSEYRGQATMLYVQGKDGKFSDITSQAGLYFPDSKCMGLTVFDYDEDGDLDIFQANDHQLNFLFRNDGGKFIEIGVISGVAANSNGIGSGSMHGSLGDIDGDALTDILVTDLEHSALYRNLGNGLYEDISGKSGIAAHFRGKGGWGAALIDYDNDGDLDIISANGTAEELILQHPLLLENDGKANFKSAGSLAGGYFGTKRSGRGLAAVDYDNDGDIDVVINHVDKDGGTVLLRNETGNGNHWLGISLTGKDGAYPSIGAKVTLVQGSRKQVRIYQASTGYLSNSDPRIHFGLGSISRIDSIEIQWINGNKEVYRDIPSNRYIEIREGFGIVR